MEGYDIVKYKQCAYIKSAARIKMLRVVHEYIPTLKARYELDRQPIIWFGKVNDENEDQSERNRLRKVLDREGSILLSVLVYYTSVKR